MFVCTPRETPPAQTVLPKSLDNRNFRKGREFGACMNAPALERFDEFGGKAQRCKRESSETAGFLSCRNDRHTGETACRRDRRERIFGDGDMRREADFRGDAP